MERKEFEKVNNVIYWTWVFTDYEKSQLKEELNNYNSIAVEQFINDIELICKYTKVIINGTDITLDRDGIKTIIKGLKKGVDSCELYLNKKVQLDRPYKLSDIFSPTFEAARPGFEEEQFRMWLRHQFVGTQIKLRTLIGILEFILEETKRKPGERRRTDDIEIVKYLAHSFSIHFERPTTYESGPFRAVVKIVLEALDLPSKSPDRAIRKAIQDLPTI